MKKMLLMTIFSLAIIIASDAQEFKLGLGISATDITEISDGEATGKVGGQIGGSLVFGDKFYFEPGVYYVTKSTELTFNENTEFTEDQVKAKIKGIRVPVAVGVGLLGNNESLASVRVFGGASGFFVTGTGDDIPKGDVEKTSWGVFAGAGINVWILFADLSYEWSLTDISNDVQGISIGKQRSLFGNVGIRLKF